MLRSLVPSLKSKATIVYKPKGSPCSIIYDKPLFGATKFHIHCSLPYENHHFPNPQALIVRGHCRNIAKKDVSRRSKRFLPGSLFTTFFDGHLKQQKAVWKLLKVIFPQPNVEVSYVFCLGFLQNIPSASAFLNGFDLGRPWRMFQRPGGQLAV